MTAIIDTLNHAYGVQDGARGGRSPARDRVDHRRALFVLVSFALMIVGPQLAEPVARRLASARRSSGRGAFSNGRSRSPGRHRHRVGLLLRARRRPGMVVARARHPSRPSLARASLGFRYYVINVTHYTETYGALGGAMVLLLWFYLSGFVLLLGAVMNAKIEHAAPIGKNPGEKVEGQKRRIGTAAMRRWIAARRGRHRARPSADDIRKVPLSERTAPALRLPLPPCRIDTVPGIADRTTSSSMCVSPLPMDSTWRARRGRESDTTSCPSIRSCR